MRLIERLLWLPALAACYEPTIASCPSCASDCPPIDDLAAGGAFVCAVTGDKGVACWGRNEELQLGAGVFGGESSIPLPVISQATGQPLEDVTTVVAGTAHACALLGNGTVECWGSNASGQLGDATVTSRASAAPVPALSTVVALGAGETLTCAVVAAGVVSCWGDGSTTPMAVAGLERATAVTVGGGHACAVDDGLVYCWGDNTDGQLGVEGGSSATPVRVANVAGAMDVLAGKTHTCARSAARELLCWGRNDLGQLGLGTFTSTPNAAKVDLGREVVSYDLGAAHTCATLEGGATWCWGSDAEGQVGDGVVGNNLSPAAIVLEETLAEDIAAVRAGDSFTCALTERGRVVCWGDNTWRQLASRAPAMTGQGIVVRACDVERCESGASCPSECVTSVAAGATAACLVRSDATAWCWGTLASGLGNGSSGASYLPVAVEIAETQDVLVDVTMVAPGTQHACAVAAGGVWCWGDNDFGQLGVGGTTSSARAQPVIDQSDAPITGVAKAVSGEDHTCALTDEGALFCWGRDNLGQVGDGIGVITDGRADSVATGISDVAAGKVHTCAAYPDGSVRCWGENDNGRLGHVPVGGNVNVEVPSEVVVLEDATPLNGVMRVFAGGRHSCAILADESLWCWGANDSGQLGVGMTSDRFFATPVMGQGGSPLAGVTDAELGDSHSCALAGGLLHCWGLGASGQLGTGGRESLGVPVPIAVDGVRFLAAGEAFTCAGQDAGLSCWGSNVTGQLTYDPTLVLDSTSPLPATLRCP